MSQLSEYLNSDWARLTKLSGARYSKRRLWHSCSPRFAPVFLVRVAQRLHEKGWRRLAKLPALFNFCFFGLEVPPRMPIGRGLVIMHTQGTVLGAVAIGSNVTIYHQVTLGARELDFAYTLSMRPIVEDEVILGVGAKVLGGIVLGKACVVGANAVVLKDVPPENVAIGVPARNLSPKS